MRKSETDEEVGYIDSHDEGSRDEDSLLLATLVVDDDGGEEDDKDEHRTRVHGISESCNRDGVELCLVNAFFLRSGLLGRSFLRRAGVDCRFTLALCNACGIGRLRLLVDFLLLRSIFGTVGFCLQGSFDFLFKVLLDGILADKHLRLLDFKARRTHRVIPRKMHQEAVGELFGIFLICLDFELVDDDIVLVLLLEFLKPRLKVFAEVAVDAVVIVEDDLVRRCGKCRRADDDEHHRHHNDFSQDIHVINGAQPQPPFRDFLAGMSLPRPAR